MSNKIEKTIVGVGCLIPILWVTAWGLIIYAAVHFVCKYW